MDKADLAVSVIAGRQHGVFELGQYQAVGGNLDRAVRRCSWGIWERRFDRVFQVVGSPVTLEQRLMATVLDAGPQAVVSHRAAAWVWGLIRSDGAVPLEVSVPRARVRSHRGVIWHRSRDLVLADVTWRRGLPVTGLGRTILDLGAVESRSVRSAVWEAMRSHGLTWGDLIGTLTDHSQRGRSGLGVLRRVVDQHYGQIAGDSHTEDRAFQILVDSGRVPVPERLMPVTCADGVVVTPDFLWSDYKLILEVFGVDHMLNESVQQIDAHRINQLEIAGYATLVYTGKMLRSPDRLVADVSRLLRTRGWTGSLLA